MLRSRSRTTGPDCGWPCRSPDPCPSAGFLRRLQASQLCGARRQPSVFLLFRCQGAAKRPILLPFRQNYHPSWINKFPAAPIGFGHGGAAPIADIGAQVRGGLPAGGRATANYAIYVANGPELITGGHGDEHGNGPDEFATAVQVVAHHPGVGDEHADEVAGEHVDDVADDHGDEGDDHAEDVPDEHVEDVAVDIETEGTTADLGDTKDFGGRLGLVMPFLSTLEIGVSAAAGQVPIVSNGPLIGEPECDYSVFGADFSYQNDGRLDLRGQWILQKVDAAAASTLVP